MTNNKIVNLLNIEHLKFLFSLFEINHSEIRIVGGSIRDLLLGRIIKAKQLFIITDVDNIYLNFKTNAQEIINETNAKNIKTWLAEGHFWRGTMEPKIRAALYFLKYHGEEVVITSIKNVKKAIMKKAGTRIIKN